jgi:hypothetical protein
MVDIVIWIEVLSWIKALFDAAELGDKLYNYYEQQRGGPSIRREPEWVIERAYEKYKNSPDTRLEAKRVSIQYSTFSEEEVEAMLKRLKGCRDRFIKQGGGEERVMCICSVLDEVKKGNGGVLPNIDDWKRIYASLCKES